MLPSAGCSLTGGADPKADLLAARQTYSSVTRSLVPFRAQGALTVSQGKALDAAASAVDDFYNGLVIRLTGGTGSGQIREIIDYVGSTKIATVSRAWGTNPDATRVVVSPPWAV